jgi:hypothetical protein
MVDNFRALATANPITQPPDDPTTPSPETGRTDCNIYAFWGEEYDRDSNIFNVYISNKRDDLKTKVYLNKLAAALGLDPADGDEGHWAYLTEGELLSSQSITTWLIYCSSYYRPNATPENDFKDLPDATDDQKRLTVGEYMGRLIWKDDPWKSIINDALKSLMTIGSSHGPTLSIPSVEAEQILYQKLVRVHEFVQSIHNNHYGKDFIVAVEKSNYDICVKNRSGGTVNCPASSDGWTKAIKIEQTDSWIKTTDTPAADGAWIKPGQTSLLDLGVFGETRNFQTDESKIGCFCKLSKLENINKVINNGNKFVYKLNLDSKNTDFYIKDTGSEEFCYISADVETATYYIDNKVWVRFKVNGPSLFLDPSGNNVPGRAILNSGLRSLLVLFGRNNTSSHEDNNKQVNPGNIKVNNAISNMFQQPAQNTPTPGPLGLMNNFVPQAQPQQDPGQDKDARVVGNLSSDNISSMYPVRDIPYGVALPFKSNVFVYGPWAAVYDPTGGTEVADEDSLAPWKYIDTENPYYNDGYAIMNLVGQATALEGPRGRQYHEEGSITAVELPNLNLGFVGNTILTNMTVTMGASQGLVTTYSFKTYTPKTLAPTKYMLTEIDKIRAIKQKINQYIKQDRIKSRSYSNALKAAIQQISLGTAPGVSTDPTIDVHKKASPVEVLMTYYSANIKQYACGAPDLGDASVYDSRIEQGLCKSHKYIPGKGWINTLSKCDPCRDQAEPPPPLDDAPGNSDGNDKFNWSKAVIHPNYYFERHQTDSTYKHMAITSLDALFLPVSLKGGPDGHFARYASYNEPSEVCYKPGTPQRSKTRCEIPPFTLPNNGCAYDLPINQKYLNPMLSKYIIDNTWTDGRLVEDHGFLVQTISYGEDFKKYPLGNSMPDTAIEVQEQDDFRFSALRGPLVLQSWGYDTSGKPIPNAIDCADSAAKGKFQKNGLKDRFMDNCMKNPKTWPIGPIDLRWDRERGVWVCPPPNKIVVARLKEELKPYGMAVAELLNPEAAGVEFYQEYAIWGPDGQNIKKSIRNAEIKVYDYLGVSLCKYDIIYASYDDGKYIILESSRTYDPNLQCCVTATTSTTTSYTTFSQPTTLPPTATPCWCSLECLQTLENFNWCKRQALIHDDKCLLWEDIVECYPNDIPSTPCAKIPL